MNEIGIIYIGVSKKFPNHWIMTAGDETNFLLEKFGKSGDQFESMLDTFKYVYPQYENYYSTQVIPCVENPVCPKCML